MNILIDNGGKSQQFSKCYVIIIKNNGKSVTLEIVTRDTELLLSLGRITDPITEWRHKLEFTINKRLSFDIMGYELNVPYFLVQLDGRVTVLTKHIGTHVLLEFDVPNTCKFDNYEYINFFSVHMGVSPYSH